MKYIELEEVSGIGKDEFFSDYLLKNRPVLIKGAIAEWPAMSRWDYDFFDSAYGDLPVGLGGIGNDIIEEMSFGDYIEHMRDYDSRDLSDLFKNQDILYLRAFNTLNEDDEKDLRKRILRDLSSDWKLPGFMPQNLYLTPPIVEGWDPTTLDDQGFGMFFSPKGGLTELHVDVCQSDGFLCQVLGRKRAYLMSTDQTKFVRDELKSRLADDHQLNPHPVFGQATSAFYCDVEPGDVLYIPSQWSHEVYTLEKSISLGYHCIHSCKALQIMAIGAEAMIEHLESSYQADTAVGETIRRLSLAKGVVDVLDDEKYSEELKGFGVDDASSLKMELQMAVSALEKKFLVREGGDA